MKRFGRKTFLGLALSALVLGGCRDRHGAQGVVEAFVDQHYVHFDLEKAKEYSVGLAMQKIDEEIRLTSGHPVDATTRKPRVHYRLLEKKEEPARASFLYEATIEVEDAPQFTRRLLIAARKEREQWRVSNFTEYD